MIEREKSQEEISPRIHVKLSGVEYRNIKNFRLTGDVLTVTDGFSFELPSPNGEARELLKANVHRWFPIQIWHTDPLVMQGVPRLQLTGVVTQVEYHTGSGPSTLHVRGYDLGKLLDSCGPAWARFAGSTWEKFTGIVLDPSWMAKTATDWGFKGVVGVNLNAKIKLGREGAQRAYFRKLQEFVPPLQIEVGEVIHDTLSRKARLVRTYDKHGTPKEMGGSLINVSADGYLQIMNPEDDQNEETTYVFEYHPDGRNQRIKSATFSLHGEPLYTDYACYSSVVRPPKIIDAHDPHAGALVGKATSSFSLGDPNRPIRRRMTFGDPDQCYQSLVDRRVLWRAMRAEYDEWTLTYVIQGHAMPGPSGTMTALAEGTIVEVRDSWNQVNGSFYLQRIELHQAPAPQGTTAICTLKKKGVLSS